MLGSDVKKISLTEKQRGGRMINYCCPFDFYSLTEVRNRGMRASLSFAFF